jgi:hypothetical protein
MSTLKDAWPEEEGRLDCNFLVFRGTHLLGFAYGGLQNITYLKEKPVDSSKWRGK